jgi:hypothetical protein
MSFEVLTGTAHALGTVTNDAALAGEFGERTRGNTVSGVAASGTATVTIASPAVVTFTNTFGTAVPQPVFFTTTGALPTGLVANTVYYTIPSTVTGTTFQLATSVANALAGTAINTSGTQSGTHTLFPQAQLASTVVLDITGITLGPGDWRVFGVVEFNPAATTTMSVLEAAVSTTSGSLGNILLGGVAAYPMYGTTADASDTRLPLRTGEIEVSVAAGATANVFLNCFARFATAGLNAAGAIIVERRR